MTDTPTASSHNTHEVDNQPPALENIDFYSVNPCLQEAVAVFGGGWAEARLRSLGSHLGSAEVIQLGALANRHTPEFYSHDRFGHRIDEVHYHPAWHQLMTLGRQAEVHSLPWSQPQTGANVVRAASAFLLNHVDSGVCCPLAMAWAAVPVLRQQPEVATAWLPKLLAAEYDPRPMPLGEKPAVGIAMAMTEKQGGSDLRSNSTEAAPDGTPGPGQSYRLTGHKWFCSAPMSDALLTLAQSQNGLSCFLVPRWLADGSHNRIRIQRLKDKLGNRSNASAEIEYEQASGIMIGEEGRGIATIIEMAQRTRLDVSICGAALMRQALQQACHHVRHRLAFQRRLVDQPLMRAVLADLALESEAATVLVLRIARAYDRADEDPQEKAFARLVTAIAKYWISARAPGFVFEAMQCLGGNGYIEESILPRLYREAPLGAIWEGCGNVICLDVLRVLDQDREATMALLAEIEPAAGLDKTLALAFASLRQDLQDGPFQERAARHLAERLAITLQAALLLRYGHGSVAEGYVGSRLRGEQANCYGGQAAELPTDLLLDRILTL